MLELFARAELRPYPMRLLSTARPCFGIIFWVLVFRKNLRIGTARLIRPNRATSVFKPAQTFFKLGRLLRHLASQNRRHLFMQMPHLICGHGFESIGFHGRDPPVLFSASQGALQRTWRRADITSYRFGTMEKVGWNVGRALVEFCGRAEHVSILWLERV